MRDLLIIFVKSPEPGSVKTRLTPDVSPEEAARLYKAMSEDIVEAFAASPAHDTVVFFTPPGARPDVTSWLGETLPLLEQEGDDLGERQSNALEYAFRNGYERAVIIGTDCVTLKRSDIERTLSALDDVDLVLGPSVDGGYYLVGARAPLPRVFEQIDWGTERVLGQTLKRARAARLNYVLLEPRRDIDTWADAMQIFSGMDGKVESQGARRTMEVLESLSRRKA